MSSGDGFEILTLRGILLLVVGFLAPVLRMIRFGLWARFIKKKKSQLWKGNKCKIVLYYEVTEAHKTWYTED